MITKLLAGGLGQAVDGILGRFFTDKDEQARAAHEIRAALISYEGEALKAARDVVTAEAKSEHWITAAWRPLTMLTFTAIVANNYIIAPYADALFSAGIRLEMPAQLWELLKIGIGGYIVGRSGEKIAKQIRGKDAKSE